MSFLTDQDPAPFRKKPALVPCAFLLVSDHAGLQVPQRLGRMGVSDADWQRHIACDIGIREVGHFLHQLLGASLIEQVYSRLVIDCNRSPGHRTSIPSVSDHTVIEANQSLSDRERREREETILHPYHEAIEEELAGMNPDATVLVSLHSFTPVMNGFQRPWHVGLLHDHDSGSAQIMIELMRREGLCVGDNEPYVLNSLNDYTVPFHAARRNLPALEIEIRQDLIAEEAGQREWAGRLARLLPAYWIERQKRGVL
ncbi:N-formylglutamate amidohydrolase [Acetobacteraceae bacterium ESL0709]|nr:N-formylglutamate amidohydrolase [Acetobacteraceae bacterium ESL0697]MDF7678262.1 N-formylglutamate amidohydrolase [Acetobacteraceae bacterium ESL0709]